MAFKVPNLDGMDVSEVNQFAENYCTRDAIDLFCRMSFDRSLLDESGYACTDEQLKAVTGVYALHKAQAMRHRLAGAVVKALGHESMCDRAYDLLSLDDCW